MFTVQFANIRDAVVSAAAAILVSTVIVGAAVVPAQTAIAATLGL